jgi:hypothetical protein
LKGFVEPRERVDDARERSALLVQPLGALGIRPNVGSFELAIDLLEALALRVEVKDTSAKPGTAPLKRPALGLFGSVPYT